MENRPVYLARIPLPQPKGGRNRLPGFGQRRQLTGERPVVLLTREEVFHLTSMESVTVVVITTTVRGLGTEVLLDEGNGVERVPCVINADNVHTIEKELLGARIGELTPEQEAQLADAIRYAFALP